MERYIPHIKQFVKFGIVGVGNSIIDFAGFLIATRIFDLHYLAANTLSWTIAVSFSFVVNKFWTFRSRETAVIGKQSIKFFIVSAVALALSLIILDILIRILGIHDLIAKILTIGIIVFWNFFLNKYWTFKPV